jgi:hypothetical protein
MSLLKPSLLTDAFTDSNHLDSHHLDLPETIQQNAVLSAIRKAAGQPSTPRKNVRSLGRDSRTSSLNGSTDMPDNTSLNIREQQVILMLITIIR